MDFYGFIRCVSSQQYAAGWFARMQEVPKSMLHTRIEWQRHAAGNYQWARAVYQEEFADASRN